MNMNVFRKIKKKNTANKRRKDKFTSLFLFWVRKQKNLINNY